MVTSVVWQPRQIASGTARAVEVFLSADRKTPKKAVADGFAIGDSLFTYATGKIVLFSKSKDLVQGEATLKDGKFEKIAIANPQTAPYGAAAVEVMNKLGVYDALAPKIVQGNNIAQTYQFVDTATPSSASSPSRRSSAGTKARAGSFPTTYTPRSPRMRCS